MAEIVENQGMQTDPQQNQQGDGDQTAGKDDSTPKTFTQEEVDALIKKRLERANKPKEYKPKENKQAPNPTDEKISALETKLLCYEKDIAKDSVNDALALAKSYVSDEVDLSKALDMVLEKYPSFGSQMKPATTGVKTQGDGKKLDGVEAAFLKRNPNLKI